MLLVFGLCLSCFSGNVFAAGKPQSIVPLSGGEMTVYWHSKYNGTGVSYGTISDGVGHPVKFDRWSGSNATYNRPREPQLDAVKITFNQPFHLEATRDYLFQLAGIGVKFGLGVGGTMSMYDQYNNTVWSGTSYSPGNDYSQNGFLYFLMRDTMMSLDVKTVYIRFSHVYGYDDGAFDTDGKSYNTWMQVTALEDGASADDVIKAIEDQTAVDQSRYDDFISNGGQQGPDAVSGAQESVSGKIGLLDFAEGVLSDFIGLFSATPGDATLTLPGFKWHDSDTDTDLTVWEPQTFDFAFIEEYFGPLVSAMRVGTVLTVYGALLWYLQAVFDRIFGGGDGNN